MKATGSPARLKNYFSRTRKARLGSRNRPDLPLRIAKGPSAGYDPRILDKPRL